MGEQATGRDPKTGKRLPPPIGSDAAQNRNYQRHTEPGETARDFSRPHTIPKDEYEETTGKNHEEAIADWNLQEAKRKADEAAFNAAEE